MGTILLIGVGAVVVLLAFAAILMPGKPKAQLAVMGESLRMQPAQYAPEPAEANWQAALAQMERHNQRSLRDRELDEDSAAIAAEFRRARHERYIDSLRTDAANYFASSPAAKKSAT